MMVAAKKKIQGSIFLVRTPILHLHFQNRSKKGYRLIHNVSDRKKVVTAEKVE
jgi:hypothetical protein